MQYHSAKSLMRFSIAASFRSCLGPHTPYPPRPLRTTRPNPLFYPPHPPRRPSVRHPPCSFGCAHSPRATRTHLLQHADLAQRQPQLRAHAFHARLAVDPPPLGVVELSLALFERRVQLAGVRLERRKLGCMRRAELGAQLVVRRRVRGRLHAPPELG